MKLSPATLTTIVIVLSISAAGAAIRWIIATAELLWLDELHTSWAVNATLGEVAGRAADGNQSPLFFWLTWIPVQLLGESELAIRAVSWLAGLGVMLASAWLAWSWTRSSIAAIVVAILVAIDLQFVYYATEARPYCLIQLLSVIQVALFWRLMDQTLAGDFSGPAGKRSSLKPAWSLAILSASLIYVHFTAIWIFVVEFCFLLQLLAAGRRSRGNGEWVRIRHFGTRLFTTAVVSVLICIPAIVQMLSVFERRGNWEVVSSPVSVLREQSGTFVLSIVVPLICLTVILCVRTWNRRGSDITEPKRADTLNRPLLKATFVLLWALIPTACVVCLAAIEVAPIALTRYTLVGSAAFPIFVGLIVGLVKTSTQRFAIAAVVVGIAFWHNPEISFGLRKWELPVLRVENWQAPIDLIKAHQSKARHPVFLFSNLIEDVDSIQNQDARFQRYLLFPIRGLYEVENSNRELIARPTLPVNHFAETDIEKIKQRGGAWVLVRGDPQILDEVANELRQRLTEGPGIDGDPIRFNLLESPESPVYLISIDW